MNQTRTDVAGLLEEAALRLQPAPDREPWDRGWAMAEYRRSSHAAIAGPRGPQALDEQGCKLFEAAVAFLLGQPEVKRRWNADELWTTVASLLVHASGCDDPKTALAEGLRQISSCKPALVAFPLANVRWNGSPLVLKNCVLGSFTDELIAIISAAAGKRNDLAGPSAETWIQECLAKFVRDSTADSVVLFANWSVKQGDAAFDFAQAEFDTLIGLVLLLHPNLDDWGLFSGRGNSHRPGVRGLTVDRVALHRAKSVLASELHAQPIYVSDLSTTAPVHWYGEDPFPLDRFLENSQTVSTVSRCMYGTDVVVRRIRVAARWFAQAFWSFTSDDMVLALGVALDALLGTRAGLPGRAMSERFALLESDPDRRQERAKRFGEIYQVRSAVAHGGHSKRQAEDRFVRYVQKDVSWAALRLLDLGKVFRLTSDETLDATFDGLRWGTLAWSPLSTE